MWSIIGATLKASLLIDTKSKRANVVITSFIIVSVDLNS